MQCHLDEHRYISGHTSRHAAVVYHNLAPLATCKLRFTASLVHYLISPDNPPLAVQILYRITKEIIRVDEGSDYTKRLSCNPCHPYIVGAPFEREAVADLMRKPCRPSKSLEKPDLLVSLRSWTQAATRIVSAPSQSLLCHSGITHVIGNDPRSL